jgi:hypothetical protein
MKKIEPGKKASTKSMMKPAIGKPSNGIKLPMPKKNDSKMVKPTKPKPMPKPPQAKPRKAMNSK